MSRIGLIIAREYKQMVFKKSFLFTTIIAPVLVLILCGVLPVFLANVKSDEQKVVAVVDNNPGQPYASALQNDEEYTFSKISENLTDGNSLYKYYIEHKDADGLYAIVQIPDSLEANPRIIVYSDESINAGAENAIRDQLQPILEKERVESFGIDSLETIISQCKVHIDVKDIKWGEEGDETLSNTMMSEILGMVLAFLTYMFVLMFGAMIMNGVIEEKSNRIVEVIVSACKPMELMFGKIIGVALVGFTQIAVWAILLGVAGTILGTSVVMSGVASPDLTQMAQDPAMAAQVEALQENSEFSEIVQMILSVNYTKILAFFVIYFIGGYLLYASLFAAFGSAVDEPGDASQFMMPIMLIMIFAIYAGMFSIENPDGPLAWWCSLIPFTSPIVMMIRLPYEVPVWEMAVSIGLLYACAFLILYIAGRIYRTGILMYGKKFGWKDILKWIK